MSNTLVIIGPAFFFLILGVIFRRKAFLNEQDIASIAKLALDVFLPIVLMYAFATADYSIKVIYYAIIMFSASSFMFFVGKFLNRYVLKGHVYMPFMMTGFEIGMLGYALYSFLYGSENISNIALLDVGHCLFIFPVYFTFLGAQKNKINAWESLKIMAKSPFMLGFEIGLLIGVTGLGSLLNDTVVFAVFKEIFKIVSPSLSAIILMKLGYGIQFSKKHLKHSLITAFIRLLIMGITGGIVILIFSIFVGMDSVLLNSIVLVFMLPPVFATSAFIKDKNENDYISTTISIYTLLTIGLFIVLAVKR